MDASTVILAVRLARERAAALEREQRIRRSLADRGTGITPARPVVDALNGLGVWFRHAFGGPVLRYS